MSIRRARRILTALTSTTLSIAFTTGGVFAQDGSTNQAPKEKSSGFSLRVSPSKNTSPIVQDPNKLKVEAFKDEKGVGYFAILLKDTSPAREPSAVDLAVLVDLSARQSGERWQNTVGIAEKVIGQLVGGSRVAIYTTGKPTAPLTSTPGAIGSATLRNGLEKLRLEAPIGTSDLNTSMVALADWIDDSSGSLPKTIVYIGDGLSTSTPFSAKTLDEFVRKMKHTSTTFHFVPIGGVIDAQGFQTAATSTGGRLYAPGKDSTETAKMVANGLWNRPVHHAKLTFASGAVRTVPQNLPPIRNDVETLVVGTWKPQSQLAFGFTGERDGKAIHWESKLDTAAQQSAAYLKELFAHWSKQANTPVMSDGPTSLQTAKRSAAERTERVLAEAKTALASRHLELAEESYREALRAEPGNLEAQTGLAAITKLKTGKDPRPANPETPSRLASNQDQEPTRKAPPPPVPNAPEDKKISRPTSEQGEDLAKSVAARDLAERQRLTRVVRDAVRDSQKLMKTDPESAIQLLKSTLISLESSSIDPASSAALRSQLERQLRTNTRLRQRVEMENLERQRALMQTEARKRQDSIEVNKQMTQSALMDRYRTLFGAGDYKAAMAIAKQVVENDPDEVAGNAALASANLMAHHSAIEEIEQLKRERWYNTLYMVEHSAIPFPDDPLVVYPSAKVWEELSIRRQKWKVMDLAPTSESEEKIRNSLSKPITLNFNEMPLSEVIEFLREYTGSNILIDKASLQEANVDETTPITINVAGITLKNALKLMLEPIGLSYLIKNEVLMIMSKEAAQAELITRVYPVADLVMPILDFNSGGVGLGGALGGGNSGQGGLGGGGFGGFGGSGGGGGRGGGGNGGAGAGGGGNNLPKGDLSEEIIDLIKRTIDPDSWEDNGGDGTIRSFGKNLIIRSRNGGGKDNTREVQQGIAGKPGGEKTAPTAKEWDELFAGHNESERGLKFVILKFAKAGRHDQILLMLQSALKHQTPKTWMYEAMALSQKQEHVEPEEIARTLSSMVDLDSSRLDLRWYAAQALYKMGQPASAIKMLRDAAKVFPGSVNTLWLAFDYGDRSGDIETVIWAAGQLLGREWPRQSEEIHKQTRERLVGIEMKLREDEKAGQADRVRAVAQAAQQRDLEVQVHWLGDADIDLSVVEPNNLLCCARVPRTVNGGVLVTDGISSSETYVAAEAYKGNYDLLIHPIWGKPTGGIVTVDIIRHKGSPNETRERRTVKVDTAPKPITIALDAGRRTAPSMLSPDDGLILADFMQKKGRQPAPLRALREMVGEKNGGGRRMARAGGDGENAGGRDGFAPPFGQIIGGGALGFDPVITVLNNGSTLQAQAAASADRRYVRMNLVPVVQTIDSIDNPRTISIQGTTGGGR